MKNEWKHLNLVDYVNGTISEEERQEVEAALEQDPELRSELALIRREINMMRTAAEDPYEETRLASVHESVMDNVRSESRAPAMFNSAWRSYMRAVGVMLLMVVVLALFFILRPEGATDSPAAVTEQTKAEAAAEQVDSTKPVTIQMTTSNPKIKIFWTVYRDTEAMD